MQKRFLLENKKTNDKKQRSPVIKKFFAVFMLLSAVGCSTYKSSNLILARTALPELTREEQARIHDIPFPSQIKPIKILFSQTQIVLYYLTTSSHAELIEFFKGGMDYWGWELQGNIVAQESCIMFTKPSKICVITFRPEDEMTRVTLFSTSKKQQ